MPLKLTAAGLVLLCCCASAAGEEDWSGLYAGVLGGYADGEIDAIAVGLTRPIAGGTLGATIGYRIVEGPVALGVEADMSWSNMRFEDSSSTFSLTSLSTLRVQAGLPVGWALPYLTAGLAAGTGRLEVPFIGSDLSRTHFGLTAGVGVEVALGHTFSVKAEHLRVGLGGQDYAAPAGAPTSMVGFDFGITRMGINARF